MTTARYGFWSSPLSAQDLAVGSVRLGEPRYDGNDLYWTEGRAAEQGRVVLLRERDGVIAEVAPGLSVRTRVHEYGGGAWDARDGVVVVSSDPSGQLLRVDGDEPIELTPAGRRWRFADLRVRPELGLVLAVREDHEAAGEPLNCLVALRLDGSNSNGGAVLIDGADFYACPELSGAGELAWMQWQHPNMPWDDCQVVTGRLVLGALRVDEVTVVAGGPGEAAVHPLWRGEELLYCTDRTGFWELHARNPDGTDTQLTELDADLVEPLWVFGRRPVAVTGDGDLVLRPRLGGQSHPMLLREGEYLGLTADAVDCDSVDAADQRIVLLADFADVPTAIVELTPGHRRVVRASAAPPLEPAWVSHPEPVTWVGSSGEVYGWFYPPANPDVTGPEDELPPLIVISHGGPTGFSTAGFAPGVQFWTTRGFAVLDVNYSGSSGYGRAYRDRLRGEWGVLDVADCIAGAEAMAASGRADGRRLVIRGGSAGGYTTLRALTTSNRFAAGCSHYGIGDLTALATDTHKFESRYLDGLIGPWPEAADVYKERSPINHVDALNCPMLILQGAEDQVVPPNQAEAMAKAVAAKGLDVELIVFEGEGHGFRKAESVARALEAELAFYQRVLGTDPPVGDLS